MLRQTSVLATITVALFVCADVAHAGPWVHAPGAGYVKAGVGHFRAQDGMREGVATGLAYRATTVSLYGEVGLPGRLQLVGYLPWVLGTNESASTGVSYHNGAIGDVTFALDHAPVRDLPFTVGVEVKVPAYADPSELDSARGIDDAVFDPAKFPVIGDHNVDVTPRVQFGHSFHPVPMWVQAELGYRWRGCRLHGDGSCQDLRDGIVIAGTLGGFAWQRRLIPELYAKAVVNVQPETSRTVPTEQSLYLQGKLTYAPPSFRGLGLTAGIGGLPYARAAARGFDVSFGVAYRF